MSNLPPPPEHEGFELVATGTADELRDTKVDYTHWDMTRPHKDMTPDAIREWYGTLDRWDPHFDGEVSQYALYRKLPRTWTKLENA